MAYFNHAFTKGWLAVGAAPADGTATSALTPGQLGLVRSDNWEVDAAADIVTAKALAYLVGGNFHATDNIGNNPGHGGYQESIKSKGINFNYISRLGKAAVVDAAQATACLEVGSTCAPCGQNLFVRADVKGSPALRFLNHNAYAIGDSSGDAAANGGPLPGLCCVDGQEYPIVAPFMAEGNNVTAIALGAVTGTGYTTASGVATTGGTGTGLTVDITAAAGDITAVTVANPGSGYTNGDVITITQGGGASDDETATLTVSAAGMVVTVGGAPTVYTIAEVLDGTYTPSTDPVGDAVTAKVCVVGAYVDTKFGNCSFDTRDHYEKEPVSIILSAMDETGNPCNDCGVATATPGQMAQTSGETVLRHLLMTERYAQNPYNQGNRDSSRIREIEGFDPILAAVDRNALYVVYYLQHSVPRLNNPSGVFDNDQYLYQIYVKSDDAAAISALDTMFNEIEAACLSVGNYNVDFDPAGGL
jgi:hypothetical protein